MVFILHKAFAPLFTEIYQLEGGEAHSILTKITIPYLLDHKIKKINSNRL
jgi:hypothetical protein